MVKFCTFLIFLILVFVTINPVMSETIPTPNVPPEGIRIISADDAKKLISENAFLVDARGEVNFMIGHMPGAVNLPFNWTKKGLPDQREGKFDLTMLPPDKNTPIIFHSQGSDGWKSYFASKSAKEAGYKNIMWFRDGLSDWVKKGYTLEH